MIRRYTKTAMALHWLIALLIVVNVGLAWAWPNVADESVRPLIDNHKSIGILVLGLAIMRLLWRLTHRPPALPTGYAKWEVTASHVTHWLLYLIMFAMPLTGWIMDSAWKDAATHPMYWFHLFEWPRIGGFQSLEPATRDYLHDLFGALHGWFAYALYALFALHVGGALKHQFLDREPELQRMLP
ncbi:cytochrome b [Sphingomonas immobilis]|uniref:Cytochrome b n=1 Tax=Sphingomonas immobilis TaxID=3063997 RepID=A0ABT8ZY54_9SPHN|nr:cytochrome b [Sphingomonas sp. CA1-15]MDO7841701.1 cytochrome b [Sphingomonas sp. CA1-15]